MNHLIANLLTVGEGGQDLRVTPKIKTENNLEFVYTKASLHLIEANE